MIFALPILCVVMIGLALFLIIYNTSSDEAKQNWNGIFKFILLAPLVVIGGIMGMYLLVNFLPLVILLGVFGLIIFVVKQNYLKGLGLSQIEQFLAAMGILALLCIFVLVVGFALT